MVVTVNIVFQTKWLPLHPAVLPMFPIYMYLSSTAVRVASDRRDAEGVGVAPASPHVAARPVQTLFK